MTNRILPSHITLDSGVEFMVQTAHRAPRTASPGMPLHHHVQAKGVTFSAINPAAIQQMLADEPNARVSRLNHHTARVSKPYVAPSDPHGAQPVMHDDNAHKQHIMDRLWLLASPPPAKALSLVPLVGLATLGKNKRTMVTTSVANVGDAAKQLRRIALQVKAGTLLKTDAITQLIAVRRTHKETVHVLKQIMSGAQQGAPTKAWLQAHNLSARQFKALQQDDKALLTKIHALENEINALSHYITAAKILLRAP
ncbi:MAG TPA: hypothetical protein PLQ67_04515 [Burkholderiaceae bacterium]|mgnify:CR=1 FL=1|nr:hypothetical protein [Burkholderiaceae bacterium]